MYLDSDIFLGSEKLYLLHFISTKKIYICFNLYYNSAYKFYDDSFLASDPLVGIYTKENTLAIPYTRPLPKKYCGCAWCTVHTSAFSICTQETEISYAVPLISPACICYFFFDFTRNNPCLIVALWQCKLFVCVDRRIWMDVLYIKYEVAKGIMCHRYTYIFI